MSKFEPSIFQTDIFNFIEHDIGSAIIEAVAGSGKTTTIIQALEKINPDKDSVFLAFNKSIANELKERTPDHVQVQTLNSLGHRAWCKFAGRVKLESNKTREILFNDERISNVHSEFMIRKCQTPVRKLVSIAKAVGLVPEASENVEGLVKDTKEAWDKLIEHHDIQFGEHKDELNQMVSDKDIAIKMARHVLEISIEKRNVIDFDDQLYMTVIFNAPMTKYDFVFVDEAQDVSDIQRAMLTMAVKPHIGRLVAVGDPRQAIYGFRGADSESLSNIAKTFNARRLPLSISYRCPKRIVREAQRYVSHIQPHENAIEGEVKSLGTYKYTMFQPYDFVLCRCTAPLIKLAYTLIGNKVRATVLGRDIGKGLTTLIKKLKPMDINDLIYKVGCWKDQEVERAMAKDPEANISPIEDKHDVIMMFIECTGSPNVSALTTSIENLFSDNTNGGVTLATVHRSKGLEAERVFILDSWLMPLKHAKKSWQKEQEVNLQYVAVTRSKQTLIYVESPKKENK